jgi:putative RecB family exonuclease
VPLQTLLPPAERDPATLEVEVARAVEAMQTTDEYGALGLDDKDAAAFAKKCATIAAKVFDVVEPDQVNVGGLELRLEVDLDGWTLRGIIDVLVDDNGTLAVWDWKSGRAPSERFESKAMLGIHFYSLMCELHFGSIPAEVKLVYLDSRKTISARPNERTNRAMRQRITAVRQAIERACERDDFRPAPSRLCDWCSFKDFCPAHGGDPSRAAVELGVRS